MGESDHDAFEEVLAALARAPELDPQLAPGGLFGPFELVALLGEGGMGRVFHARDTELGEEVALKLLRPERIDRELALRLEREARLLSRLSHPHVVRVLRAGSHDGTPFLVLELVRGQTLRAALRSGDLTSGAMWRLAMGLTDALEAMHGLGLIHRDLKPENVMIEPDGNPKLLDFGLAKTLLEGGTRTGSMVTHSGAVLGTAGYMSPEQVRAQPLDVRSDLFSLGAVLYEVVCREPAFTGPSGVETMHAILTSLPTRLGTLGALDRVIARCLEKSPERRFQSAAELREALHQAQARQARYGATPQEVALPPVTRYAKSGEVHLAYQVVGRSSPDLLFVPGFVSQVEEWWAEPEGTHFFGTLAAHSRLISFDKRGTGLSDRVPDERLPDLDERMADLGAVLDAAGSERAVLFGISEGGPLCMRFAAEHPERTLGLVLYGSSAMFGDNAAMQHLVACARNAWGTGKTLELFGPSYANDARALRWSARWERLGASPGAALRILEMLARVDVRASAARVRTPTLILHRRGDRAVPLDAARWLARHIAGARLVELAGDDHVPMFGDADAVLGPITQLLRELADPPNTAPPTR